MPYLGNASLSEEQIKADAEALFRIYRETHGTNVLSDECQKLLQKAIEPHLVKAAIAIHRLNA